MTKKDWKWKTDPWDDPQARMTKRELMTGMIAAGLVQDGEMENIDIAFHATEITEQLIERLEKEKEERNGE